MSFTIWDKEANFKNPVQSPVDGKHYTNSTEWKNHLKRNNCVEMGNDAPREAPREIRGDFACKEQVAEAMKRLRDR